eukprot:SAG31_NODE_1032_length_10231_cov_3.718417_3_plen_105_part_00
MHSCCFVHPILNLTFDDSKPLEGLVDELSKIYRYGIWPIAGAAIQSRFEQSEDIQTGKIFVICFDLAVPSVNVKILLRQLSVSHHVLKKLVDICWASSCQLSHG